MKTIISIIVLLSFLLLSCGHDKVVNGVERQTIGLISILINDPSITEPKWPDVKYKVIWGNVIWGAILIETIIAPIYFFGFSMFEPIGPYPNKNNAEESQ